MKQIKKIAALLSVVFVLATSVSSAYASSCPPHPSYAHMRTYYANNKTVGTHTVDGKTCTIYEIYAVYVYKCVACPDTFENSSYSHLQHSVSH